MIPMLESEKAKAGTEAENANRIAEAATKKEAEVTEMKASIEQDLAAAAGAIAPALLRLRRLLLQPRC